MLLRQEWQLDKTTWTRSRSQFRVPCYRSTVCVTANQSKKGKRACFSRSYSLLYCLSATTSFLPVSLFLPSFVLSLLFLHSFFPFHSLLHLQPSSLHALTPIYLLTVTFLSHICNSEPVSQLTFVAMSGLASRFKNQTQSNNEKANW